MLHFLQLILDLIQPENALLKMRGEAGKKRRHFRILEMFELRDDVIALFPRFHPVHKIFQPLPSQTKLVNALRKHPSKEKRKVANVFSHLALAIE